MNKNSVILMVDVETAGSLQKPLIYDMGLAVYHKGELLEKRSLIIKEVFGDGRLMKSAYYANKVANYLVEIANGEHEVVSLIDAINIMKQLVIGYECTVVAAYNLEFDLRAIRETTLKFLGMAIEFHKMEKLCIWGLACETILKQKTYRKVAERESWKSDKGNLKTSAEMAFRYISGDYNFVESHTGLKDIEIESAILSRSFRQNKRMSGGIIPNPWKLVQ